jgi:hypothetical protein
MHDPCVDGTDSPLLRAPAARPDSENLEVRHEVVPEVRHEVVPEVGPQPHPPSQGDERRAAEQAMSRRGC